MKRILFIAGLFSILIISGFKQATIPQAGISNEMIRAQLYLPDPENGYYRATRFDWSGVISSLEYKGHTYFGQWFPKYAPDIHDAIMGPVEEFTPAGYEEAKTGDIFLKPGVGMLVKGNEEPYSSFNLYKIKNSGKWSVEKKPDQIRFVQILKDQDYAYEYSKTVSLAKGGPQLFLTHVLKNTGKKAIETNVYDHNFFMIDQMKTGPDSRIKFVFKPDGKFEGPEDIPEFRDNQLLFKREIVKRENIYCGGLSGVGTTSADYDFRIENTKTGAGVRITGDKPLLKLVFWACPTTLCPEPYIHIKIEPGQEFTWKLSYEFYTFKVN